MTSATKRNVFLRRNQSLTYDEFSAYWSGPHAKLALRLPGIKNYTQNHVLRSVWTGASGGTQFDGIAEIEYEDKAILAQAMTSELGTTLLPEDEQRFLGSWTGCVVTPRDSTAVPAQRRIVAGIHRPSTVSAEKFLGQLHAATESLRSLYQCSFEVVVERRSRPTIAHEQWPDALFFFEISTSGSWQEFTEPGSPGPTALNAISVIGSAFLVRCETKKLANDPAQ